jgi:hypothetical protein
MVVARLLARRLVTLVHTLLAYFDTEEERTLQVCEHLVNPFIGEHEFGDYLRCNWCNETPFSAS